MKEFICKQTRYIKAAVFLGVIVWGSGTCFSCERKSKIEQLRRENAELRKEIFSYRRKASRSIIIEYDSIEKYVSPITIGPPYLMLGEIDTFKTALVLTKFPEGVNVSWSVINGEAELIRKNDLINTAIHVLDTADKSI